MQPCATSRERFRGFACQRFRGGPFFSAEKLPDDIEFHESCVRRHPKMLEGGCGKSRQTHARTPTQVYPLQYLLTT
jgi:hypothetical protein